MTQNESTTTEPLAETDAERQAIRAELEGTDVNVLSYQGGEPHVALVNRNPSTEYSVEGETIVLVEWAGDDYAISIAEGEDVGWELTDELVATAETREEALEIAAEQFE